MQASRSLFTGLRTLLPSMRPFSHSRARHLAETSTRSIQLLPQAQAAVESTQVLLRDGIQRRKDPLPTSFKVQMIHLLALSGFRYIEAGSCVTTPAILSDSEQVISELASFNDVTYDVLIPNLKGWNRLVKVIRPDLVKEGTLLLKDPLIGMKPLKKVRVALFTGASESFVQANIKCSIDESFQRFKPIAEQADQMGLPLRGYLSCMTDCPKEGSIDIEKTADLVMRLLTLSDTIQVVPSDTTGRANARQVSELIHQIRLRASNPLLVRDSLVQQSVADAIAGGSLNSKTVTKRLALHLHGPDLERVDAGLEAGVYSYDSSLVDLGEGGCPVVEQSKGNLNSLDLLKHLEHRGHPTGIDSDMAEFAQRHFLKHVAT